MKRRIHVLLFVLLFSPFTALVSQAATVGFNPVSTTVMPGAGFSIHIIGQGFTELSGGEFSLGYNDAVIEILSVAIDPRWDFAPVPGSKTGPGRWTGIAFDTFVNAPATGDFNIATVSFKALGSGTSTVNILNSQFFSTTVQLSPTLGSAQVKVEAVPIPAAVWLFGSGLLGLLGIARRRASGKTSP